MMSVMLMQTWSSSLFQSILIVINLTQISIVAVSSVWGLINILLKLFKGNTLIRLKKNGLTPRNYLRTELIFPLLTYTVFFSMYSYRQTLINVLFGQYMYLILLVYVLELWHIGFVNFIEKTRLSKYLNASFTNFMGYILTSLVFGSHRIIILYYTYVFSVTKKDIQPTNELLDQIGFKVESVCLLYYAPLIILSFINIVLQNKYGTRYICPRKYRTLKYNFEKELVDTFDLNKIPKEEWPTCNIWFGRLDIPSIIAPLELQFSSTDPEPCSRKSMRGVFWVSDTFGTIHPGCFIQVVVNHLDMDLKKKLIEFDD